MLIFDQLNRADKHLRVLSWIIAAGLVVLLAGLWWVQVVRSRHYVEDQRSQSYRTVRVPAPRGKILDRNGTVLAENRPSYNVSLYLEDRAWRQRVQQTYRTNEAAARQSVMVPRKPSTMEKFFSWFGYKPALTQSRRLTAAERTQLGRAARYTVTSNIVWELGTIIGEPLIVDETRFHRHYESSLALPMPIRTGLTVPQVARLQARGLNLPGIEMDIQPLRIYPQSNLAAHVVGYLRRNVESAEDELSFYDYRLPDFRGVSGIESGLDEELRGKAGGKSVLVNNLGYRQSETVLSPIEPGKHVTLTIDADIQRAAEQALRVAAYVEKVPVRGAAVALDCRTGEILAMASAPGFDPNKWVPTITPETFALYNDTNSTPMLNRAIYGGFPPGSTFKIMVSIAALEAGLNPSEVFHSEGLTRVPGRHRAIGDTAGPGNFDFRRAFIKSSNPYFIHQGWKIGREPIISVAQRLHFGERTGIPLGQDSPGVVPTMDWIRRNRGGWSQLDTANISIGQDPLMVTPLQMAVAVAAVANGGKVLWPQLVRGIAGQNDLITGPVVVQPRVRDELQVSSRTLDIIRRAMVADVEDPEGSGKEAHVQAFRVCGKTGTAEVWKGEKKDHYVVWFASYAPYEDPRYAVVVMVEYGASGGRTTAPVAGKIYRALQYREQRGPAARKDSLARN
jgi:penicillin-binding protein 2